MKALVLAAAVAATFAAGGLAATSVEASPLNKPGIHTHHTAFQKRKVTPRERAVIKRSYSHLARLKAKARADGKVTPWERAQLKRAQQKHVVLVRKAIR